MPKVTLDAEALLKAGLEEITKMVRQGAAEAPPQHFAVSRGRPGYDLTPSRNPEALAKKLLELAEKAAAGDRKAGEAASALALGNRQAFKYVLFRFQKRQTEGEVHK